MNPTSEIAIREPERDQGSSTVEILSWGAMSVVAIVAIGAAVQTLGLDVIDYVRTQIGV